jgi:hypothetical protein
MISRSECQKIASEIERLIFDETPSKLGDSIGRELDDYSVAFLIAEDGMLRPAGTGTAVTFLGSYYFLTASHVWHGKYGNDGLKAADAIVIPLKENTRKRFSVKPGALLPFGPPKPSVWSKWGPDIILLRIPTEMIGHFIAVGRTFYNFSYPKQRLIECGIECRFQIGAPAEKGVYTAQMALPEVHAMLVLPETGQFFSPVPTELSNPDFDFIDLAIDTSRPDVASNLGGVSGGGLWKVYVYRDSDGEYRTFKILEGVAFFGTPRGNSTVVLRCHGPQSIGKTLWYLMRE